MNPTQKIISLEAENVMRLRAVRLTPNGDSVVIGGANGAGKTSVLAAIQMALGGKKNMPDEPLRKGAKRAHIIVETDDFIVTRKFGRKDSSSVEVKAKDGTAIKGPQALLDKLFGSLTFDPFAFERMGGREQAELLRRLGGLDFTEQNEKREHAFTCRTEVGRELRRLRGTLEGKPPVAGDVPDEEVSVASLVDKLEAARGVNAENRRIREGLDGFRASHAAAVEQEASALEAFEAAQAALDQAKARVADLADRVTSGEAYVKDLKDVDTADLEAEVAGVEATNKQVRAKIERAELAEKLDQVEAEHRRLQVEIDDIDEAKAEAIASAEYPVDGLEVDEEGVRLNGVPFEQGSQAERLRASVAIGAAMNPKLKVMLVRDGALLDKNGIKLLAKIAEETDTQLIVEVVGEREEVTVLISDGEVVEDHHAQPEAEVAA